MRQDQRILGVIPARSGSKGIPNKNIRYCGGYPLIYWTAKAADKSRLDEVVLSTDSQHYADIVEGFNFRIKIPFLRPQELAGDHPRLVEVFQGILDHYDWQFNTLMILQPTSPLRTTKQINQAIKIFSQSDADSLISMCEVPLEYNPEWLFTEKSDGYLQVATGRPVKDRLKRRQDFPPAYMTNGSIYLLRVENLRQGNLYGDKVIPYVMDNFYNISIDNLADFDEAEQRLLTKFNN